MDYVFWNRGTAQFPLLKLAIASIRKLNPSAQIYVYTDDYDRSPYRELEVAVGRISQGLPMMAANVEAQRHHLATSELDRRVLFLDNDVLVRKTFPFGDADLLVTWRENVKQGSETGKIVAKIMPYNYGVIGARARPIVIEAFTWMRNRIMQLAPQHREWYGNQFALYELCGSPALGGKGIVPVPRFLEDTEPRLRVERLPCDAWNYSPEGAGENVEDKGILHFKGGRKDLMEGYA